MVLRWCHAEASSARGKPGPQRHAPGEGYPGSAGVDRGSGRERRQAARHRDRQRLGSRDAGIGRPARARRSRVGSAGGERGLRSRPTCRPQKRASNARSRDHAVACTSFLYVTSPPPQEGHQRRAQALPLGVVPQSLRQRAPLGFEQETRADGMSRRIR